MTRADSVSSIAEFNECSPCSFPDTLLLIAELFDNKCADRVDEHAHVVVEDGMRLGAVARVDHRRVGGDEVEASGAEGLVGMLESHLDRRGDGICFDDIAGGFELGLQRVQSSNAFVDINVGLYALCQFVDGIGVCHGQSVCDRRVLLVCE